LTDPAVPDTQHREECRRQPRPLRDNRHEAETLTWLAAVAKSSSAASGPMSIMSNGSLPLRAVYSIQAGCVENDVLAVFRRLPGSCPADRRALPRSR
jgi:hypothetical protein